MGCEPILMAAFVIFAIIASAWITRAELKASHYREQATEYFDVLRRM